jgi:hydroxymethylbilane synthase
MPVHSSPPSFAITRLVIATRASKLALWQSEHIAQRLREHYPQMTVELLPMSTKGDEILDRSLSKIGGKGLFIKELENALIDGRAHLAVHSLKDIPVDLDPTFCLAAVTSREDPRDALVGCADLSTLPKGSVVGTSSLRRAAQVLRDYPHLIIEPLRGNLDTRLGKLDAGGYAAIILAASALKRLGYGHRIAACLPETTMLPAAGQGALGIECLTSRSDIAALLAPLACMETTAATQAERAVGLVLGASCSTPLAAHSWLANCGTKAPVRHLAVWAGNATGTEEYAATYTQADSETPTQLGTRAGQGLLAQGALRFVAHD